MFINIAVISLSLRIYDKLMVHSDLSKADSWKRLTEEFLTSPLPNTEGTKVDNTEIQPNPF